MFVYYHNCKTLTHLLSNTLFVLLQGCTENKYFTLGTSFIHYEDLYSASSGLLLQSVPDLCMAKTNSFKTTVECIRMKPWELSPTDVCFLIMKFNE